MNRRAEIYLPLKQRQREDDYRVKGVQRDTETGDCSAMGYMEPFRDTRGDVRPAYTGRACEKAVDNNKLSSIEHILIYNKPLRNMVPKGKLIISRK